MSHIVTKYDVYAAWEYDKEEQDLNAASKNGLQLIKGGCFHSKFIKNSNVRYIYQLDYNTRIDPIRYREIFEEQGWEYINSTFNGWHYFRKPYREDMEEQEAKIYTDKQSLYEMQNRWMRLIFLVDILYSLMSVLYIMHGITGAGYSILVEGIVFGFLAITVALGLISMKRKRAGKEGGFVIPLQIAFPLSFLILIFIILFGF
ncbi:MAG: hypothetical protein K0S76_69 [Herbinix sp.]|jgi:hypothetical protein|nr:hypothetical protein [Herbinix sp.]